MKTFPICCLLALCASALNASGQTGRLDAYLKTEMVRAHIPGVSVAIVRNAKIVFARGYGVADVETRTPATADTVYGLMSVSKQFLAASVLLLAGEGKIALDAPASSYLPDLPPTWQPITVRHLLSHTSGVPEYTEVPGWSTTIRQDRSPQDLLKPVFAQPLLFAPGSRWRYSNSNYYLLGLILEKVSGVSLARLLQERIAGPLDLHATRLGDRDEIIPNRAAGYHWQEGALHNAPFLSLSHLWAAGGLVSSVHDMALWEIALSQGRLLPSEMVREMETPARLTDGTKAPYGFGNELGTDHGHRYAGHQGGGLAFNATVLRFPDDRLSVIVLTNLTQAPSRQIAHKIATFLLPDLSDENRPTIPDTDPQTTALLKSVLIALAEGKVDPSRFTATAQQEIVPRLARMGPRMLGPLGVLHTLAPIEQHQFGSKRLYRYRALYAKETLIWQFTLTPDGKIADLEPTRP